MKIKTNAFVLKTTLFKESSLIIRLFTREKGKSTYIIKAAMRQKSPNKAIYQQLNEVEIDYSHHPKKQIHPVYNTKLLFSWENICADLKKTVLCTSMLEIIDKNYDEEIPDSDTYDNEIGLEKQLRLVARLIKVGLGSKIYMVSIGGFDTHGNQSLTHEVLLTYVADAIKKFYDDLNYEGLDSKVLSMTFSEFGRRVKENGSQGTDHGSAAPTLLFGPPLRGSGIIGECPSLDNLNRRGNMYNSIDFRSIYQTILKDWLCGDSDYIDKAMLGNEYDALGLGFGCNDLDIVDYNDLFNYHHPIYTNSINEVNLNLRIKQSHNVTIRVYDILGRHISTIFDGQLMSGEHTFPLSHNRGGKISSGQYFYRIGISGGQTLSKSFVVR